MSPMLPSIGTMRLPTLKTDQALQNCGSTQDLTMKLHSEKFCSCSIRTKTTYLITAVGQRRDTSYGLPITQPLLQIWSGISMILCVLDRNVMEPPHQYARSLLRFQRWSPQLAGSHVLRLTRPHVNHLQRLLARLPGLFHRH